MVPSQKFQGGNDPCLYMRVRVLCGMHTGAGCTRRWDSNPLPRDQEYCTLPALTLTVRFFAVIVYEAALRAQSLVLGGANDVLRG